jgi:hypothetical protein
MIINIRGTYGSGKTTLARNLMAHYDAVEPVFIDGRKRPLYYTMEHPAGGPPLAVLGSYETVCGGCDTITDVNQVFSTVDFLHEQGFDVFYESLLLTADVGRTRDAFLRGWPLQIIALDVPMDVCVASVNQRRWARNPELPPVPTKNLESKYKGVLSSIRSLRANPGVPCHHLGREAALAKALELFNVPTLL